MNVADPRQFEVTEHDDVWIPSACALCYGSCSILVHRVNGVAVKIEGKSASAVGNDRLCGKGVSALMVQYDPTVSRRRCGEPMPRRARPCGI